MSAAAASLAFVAVPRLALQRVSEVSEVMLDGSGTPGRNSAEFAPVGRSNLSGRGDQRDAARGVAIDTSVPVSSSQSHVPALRPLRQAPVPPVQRASSFPNHKQNEDFLEYEVTSSLTLKETPRSQHRHDIQRVIRERQAYAKSNEVAQAAAQGVTMQTPHMSFAATGVSEIPQAEATDSTAAIIMPALESSPTAEVAAIMASIMPSESNQVALDNLTGSAAGQASSQQSQAPVPPNSSFKASSPAYAIEGRTMGVKLDDSAPSAMSRPASTVTLFESVDSGAFSEALDAGGYKVTHYSPSSF